MTNIKLTDIKIPGVLWVLLICIIVVVMEYAGVDAAITAVVVTAAFAVAKYLNVGTDDVDQLLAVVRQFGPLLLPRGRNAVDVNQVVKDVTPNKVTRWLVG